MTGAETVELLAYLENAATSSVRADLHVHSTVSDGSEDFASLLAQARERGITHMAFTNHDTTQRLDEAIVLGPDYGVAVVGGIEISAWDEEGGRKVHILGYGLHSDSPAVNALCSPTLVKRDAASRWQLSRLLDKGYDVDLERVGQLAAQSTALYKQHLMASLTDEPYGTDGYTALYHHLFKGVGICVTDIEYVDARAAVRAIVSDGGVAVLAHPGQLDSYDLVGELVACGLAGIERYHPDHGASDWDRCTVLADRYGLVCTGGSDYHGRFGKPTHLGCQPTGC